VAFPLPRAFTPDVALRQRELDARADQCVGPSRSAVAARPRPSTRGTRPARRSRSSDHHHRIGARREIAAIDRDLATGPRAVVAFEAQPVGDDDVRLIGRRVAPPRWVLPYSTWGAASRTSPPCRGCLAARQYLSWARSPSRCADLRRRRLLWHRGARRAEVRNETRVQCESCIANCDAPDQSRRPKAGKMRKAVSGDLVLCRRNARARPPPPWSVLVRRIGDLRVMPMESTATRHGPPAVVSCEAGHLQQQDSGNHGNH